MVFVIVRPYYIHETTSEYKRHLWEARTNTKQHKKITLVLNRRKKIFFLGKNRLTCKKLSFSFLDCRIFSQKVVTKVRWHDGRRRRDRMLIGSRTMSRVRRLFLFHNSFHHFKLSFSHFFSRLIFNKFRVFVLAASNCGCRLELSCSSDWMKNIFKKHFLCWAVDFRTPLANDDFSFSIFEHLKDFDRGRFCEFSSKAFPLLWLALTCAVCCETKSPISGWKIEILLLGLRSISLEFTLAWNIRYSRSLFLRGMDGNG